MTGAFAYLRVSGKSQIEGDGFPRQREAIERYAAANGIEIAGWFAERGVCGDVEWGERPAWSNMIASLNGTRTIIVEKLDRVARQLLIQELILKDLKQRNVELLTTAGEDTGDSDPTRIMFRQMVGIFSQYEKSMIVLKLRGARRRIKAATGKCEGRKPYGSYQSETKILARMVELERLGYNFTHIATSLNRDGYLTRYGKQWSAQTVCKILRANKNASPVTPELVAA